MQDATKDTTKQNDATTEATEENKLESGEDTAAAAIEASQTGSLPAGDEMPALDDGNFADSEDMQQTINKLERIIERNANQLDELNQELKEHRNMLKNFFENDTELQEAQEEVDQAKIALKKRKTELKSHPQVVELKEKMKAMKDERRDIKDTVSNHLINYHQLTNSTTIDMSDGTEREFRIKAAVKGSR